MADIANYPARAHETRETMLVLAADASEDAIALLSRVRRSVPAGRTPVAVFMFGRIPALLDARVALASCGWPVLAVEGTPCHHGSMAGVQVMLAPAARVHRITVGDRVVGSVFDDGDAEHCVLAGIMPGNPRAAVDVQAVQAFEALEAALAAARFSFSEIVRTWFFNHRLLEWYDAFNRARTSFYARTKFRLHASPTSTGIEGANPAGAALVVAAWATRPRSVDARMAVVLSPWQCPAFEYGSLFSRAAEIVSCGRRRIFVSGTASISAEGLSLYPGDIDAQIDRTMGVIAAILKTRGMSFADVDRATVYCKRSAFLARFELWLSRNGLAALPFLPMQADVCRDDLLFEIELDAAGAL